MEAEYRQLLAQTWIQQSSVETDSCSKNDPERCIGSGLAAVTVGISLRYEIRCEFAPYAGVGCAGRFGDTNDIARRREGRARDARSGVNWCDSPTGRAASRLPASCPAISRPGEHPYRGRGGS